MIDFNKISEQIRIIGKEYAIAKANYEMLSESKKSVIAKIASDQSEWSEATRERLARKDDRFKEYLFWVMASRQKELELKYEIDALDKEFMYYQAMNANSRTQMKI